MLKYLATAAVVASCQPAMAQDRCATFPQVMQFLDGQYGEEPIARGLSNQGVMLVVFANRSSETYTIVAVGADGTACMVDDGEGFEIILGDPA